MNDTFISNNAGAEPVSRRNFLKRTTTTVLAASVLAGAAACSTHHNDDPVNHLDVGSGDTALLNIAFALKQLEFAFYRKLNDGYYQSITAREKELLFHIMAHESAHRTLFSKTLSTSGISDLEFDFSKVDFNNRASVLDNARLMENTGVGYFNSSAYLYKNADFMAVAGKISSVEARHATVINNLISFGNFIDNQYVDLSTGMERPLTPAQVVSFVNNYAINKITAATL
jgi:rubrerythrin